MSQRPDQSPATTASNDGVVNSTSTPSRFAISLVTSMSKPLYLPVASSRNDWGG